jgi:hypothetical protein
MGISRFGETLPPPSLFICFRENGGNMFLLNVSAYEPDYALSLTESLPNA